MKPYAKYVFEKIPDSATRYILKKHSGEHIYAFPAIWRQKCHCNFEEHCIMFRETQNTRPGQRFSHTLSMEGNRMITCLNFSPEAPRKAWGYFGKDAILIEFSEDWTCLTLLFFEGMKAEAPLLYDLWVAELLDLEEIADDDVPPIPLERGNPKSQLLLWDFAYPHTSLL